VWWARAEGTPRIRYGEKNGEKGLPAAGPGACRALLQRKPWSKVAGGYATGRARRAVVGRQRALRQRGGRGGRLAQAREGEAAAVAGGSAARRRRAARREASYSSAPARGVREARLVSARAARDSSGSEQRRSGTPQEELTRV